MKKFMTGVLKFGVVFVLAALLSWWGMRAYEAWRSPLYLWHTYVPEELTEDEMDAADLEAYLKREEELFEGVRKNVTEKLPPEARIGSNRFYEGSTVYPPSLSENWNRTYVLYPEGEIKGAAIFLHGLTDAPYSLRHIARRYRERGFVAVGMRMPAHGTVPAALTDTSWEEWMAATRLAVRAARKLGGEGKPLHIVGFSNGGALAMKYALDCLEDVSLPRADRLVLISPMIGITRFARFAGLAGVPSFFPAFARSAWLSVLPEFNPFKYNSFPVNGATQSSRLTRALQSQIARASQRDSFLELPPILTFQSVMDYTVSTPAIMYGLYARLPGNGSELVLFDVNQATLFSPLMRSASGSVLSRLMPPFPQLFDISVVGNASPDDVYTVSTTTRSGTAKPEVRELFIRYPRDIFSMSHLSLPFPMDDALYGMTPPPGSYKKFGVNLGTLAARGERGALVVNLDSLFRTTSNPFFPYLMERIDSVIDNPAPMKGVDWSGIEKAAPVSPEMLERESELIMDEDRADFTP